MIRCLHQGSKLRALRESIDLNIAGKPPNDPGDADTIANETQNKLEITSVKPTKKGTRKLTTITGTLNSTPNRTFTIQLFRNLSGEDEGRTLLAQLPSITTNASGDATFVKRVRRSESTPGVQQRSDLRESGAGTSSLVEAGV